LYSPTQACILRELLFDGPGGVAAEVVRGEDEREDDRARDSSAEVRRRCLAHRRERRRRWHHWRLPLPLAAPLTRLSLFQYLRCLLHRRTAEVTRRRVLTTCRHLAPSSLPSDKPKRSPICQSRERERETMMKKIPPTKTKSNNAPPTDARPVCCLRETRAPSNMPGDTDESYGCVRLALPPRRAATRAQHHNPKLFFQKYSFGLFFFQLLLPIACTSSTTYRQHLADKNLPPPLPRRQAVEDAGAVPVRLVHAPPPGVAVAVLPMGARAGAARLQAQAAVGAVYQSNPVATHSLKAPGLVSTQPTAC
jgi:hypothetical protein